MHLTAFFKVTLANFSECRTFWRELLCRHHGQSVLLTSAKICIGCQSDSVLSIKLSVLTHKALYTVQPYYLADFIQPYISFRTLRSANCHLFAVPSCPRPFFASRILELFVYSCLITGILFPFTYVHLTVLLLLNLVLNLTFLPV